MPVSRSLVLLLLLGAVLAPALVLAQIKGGNIASSYTISDDQAQDGDIMVLTDRGVVRASVGYDNRVLGILQKNPAIALRNADGSGEPVTQTGVAQVNVTTVGGPIKAGDAITSSDIPGKGQKGTTSGYIIGRALEALSEGQGEQIDYTNTQNPALSQKISSGKISVSLRLEYAELTTSRSFERMFGPFGAAIFANVQNPDKFAQIIRYLGAGISVVAALLVGFFTFSRSISKSVEAIGRNPLAKTSIYISIAINIGFTLLITALGIVAALVILRI